MIQNNLFAAIFHKLNDSAIVQNRDSLKNYFAKTGTILFVSAVFLVAVTFLIYNSVDAIGILEDSNNSKFLAAQNAVVVTGQSNLLAIPNALPTGKTEASIYRNGRDKSGGIQFSRFPVRGSSITGGYGIRNNPFDEFGFAEFHAGLDVGAPLGTPVTSAARGVVTFAGWDGGYGNVVMIAHDNSISTRYAHLSRIDVSVGSVVSGGSLIGLVGSTGRSTGPHLHYEVRVDGKTIDPLSVYASKK